MQMIDRAAVVIRPKQPFVDWANQLPDAKDKITLTDLQKDRSVFLISDHDTDDQAKYLINKIYRNIFREELWGWCTNEDWWPKNLTKKMFWEWFDAEVHTIVLDPYEDPIIKE